SDDPLPASPSLVRGLLVDAVPASVREGPDARAFTAGARPYTDADPPTDRGAPLMSV
ncbi:MAG: spermidine synthase, partial [Williamsia herbipolensis]|nr:spermidine synthase [Williamsia herbipolensis]